MSLPALPRTFAILLVGLLWIPATVLAAPAGYQPYSGPEGGEVSAPLFVLIAYSAIWLVLLLFLFSIWRRQRRVDQEIDSLQRRLGEPLP